LAQAVKSGNPFVYNAPVAADRFIGRTNEVDQILSQLANQARVSCAVSGDPRVGKTSLLHYVRQEPVREAWGLSSSWCHVIYLDCHSIIPFSEDDFWHYILRELEQQLKDDEQLSGRVKWMLLPEQVSPDIYDLNSLFDEIARAGRLVVLLLDEFEGIVENLDPASPRLLYHLRALLNRPERGLTLILASRPPLKQLCADLRFAGSPFDNSFSAIALAPFSEAEVDQLLATYQADFSDEERAYLIQAAGRHPYLVQLTASLLVQLKNDQAGAEATTAGLDSLLERETERYFLDILDYCPEPQTQLLAWLALAQWSQQALGDSNELGNMNKGVERHEQALTQLIRRGLILSQADGPTLFSPIFGRWVLRKVLLPAGEAVLSRWATHYADVLLEEQRLAIIDLVHKIIRWPAIIRKPELLPDVAGDEPEEPSASTPDEQILGRYIIEDLIARGSMSDIYRAHDPYLGRSVAIKKLRATLSDAKEERARFERGARAIASLRHPHIVQIYDFDIENRHPYMVMEYIAGHSLRERLAELAEAKTALSRDDSLRIMSHVADALDYAHSRQMIHRDVNPDNILLAKDDGVFLAGFSLVRLLDQPAMTQTGELIGSQAYMAPEQAKGDNKKIDYRADIYALGCVVYELITGRPPFTEQLPLAHLTSEPLPPHHLAHNFPEIASRILLEALAKDPAKRPLSASQFIKDLQRALRISHPIQLAGTIMLADEQRAIIKQLYAESSHARITRVRIHQELHGGFSGASVILGQPIDERGRGLANEVIKFGPAAMLQREYNRYRRFVRGRLPMTAVSLERGPVELGGQGCLSYGFVGDQPLGTVQDLESYYDNHSAAEVAGTLERLMEPLDARWYGQSEPLLATYADEYGQDLPAHLILKAERIMGSRDFIDPGPHRPIDLEAILHASERIEIGQQVLIHDLEINEVKPNIVKLRSGGDGPEIWVRARIDVPRPDLQEGERVTVLGAIEQRRDDVLTSAVGAILDVIPAIERLPKGQLKLDGVERPYIDPLAIYKEVLKLELNGRQSIIHGDFHSGNILVDESGRAWLIDFDKVREGHVLYDFIKLEIILRLFELGGSRRLLGTGHSVADIPAGSWPHPFSLVEYAEFEHALIRQTWQQPAQTLARPELAKAAEVILAIRRLAQPYLRISNDWNEYLTGLFLHNLVQLKFYQDQPQLSVLPFTTAAVVGEQIRKLLS